MLKSPFHNSRRAGSIRTYLTLLILVFTLSQPGCIWKLWSEEPPLEEREFDVYGTVQSIDQETLVIETDEGEMEFAFIDSSIKGSDFGPGAYVHVYYRISGEERQITMVVEKIG